MNDKKGGFDKKNSRNTAYPDDAETRAHSTDVGDLPNGEENKENIDNINKGNDEGNERKKEDNREEIEGDNKGEIKKGSTIVSDSRKIISEKDKKKYDDYEKQLKEAARRLAEWERQLRARETLIKRKEDQLGILYTSEKKKVIYSSSGIYKLINYEAREGIFEGIIGDTYAGSWIFLYTVVRENLIRGVKVHAITVDDSPQTLRTNLKKLMPEIELYEKEGKINLIDYHTNIIEGMIPSTHEIYSNLKELIGNDTQQQLITIRNLSTLSKTTGINPDRLAFFISAAIKNTKSIVLATVDPNMHSAVELGGIMHYMDSYIRLWEEGGKYYLTAAHVGGRKLLVRREYLFDVHGVILDTDSQGI
ncbi:MAG: hypothetical protein QW728_01675 [Thermoplasmata archaeon]